MGHVMEKENGRYGRDDSEYQKRKSESDSSDRYPLKKGADNGPQRHGNHLFHRLFCHAHQGLDLLFQHEYGHSSRHPDPGRSGGGHLWRFGCLDRQRPDAGEKGIQYADGAFDDCHGAGVRYRTPSSGGIGRKSRIQVFFSGIRSRLIHSGHSLFPLHAP